MFWGHLIGITNVSLLCSPLPSSRLPIYTHSISLRFRSSFTSVLPFFLWVYLVLWPQIVVLLSLWFIIIGQTSPFHSRLTLSPQVKQVKTNLFDPNPALSICDQVFFIFSLLSKSLLYPLSFFLSLNLLSNLSSNVSFFPLKTYLPFLYHCHYLTFDSYICII